MKSVSGRDASHQPKSKSSQGTRPAKERQWRHAESFAPTWKPEPADLLIGRLEEVREIETKYGSREVAVIRSEEDERVIEVWISAAMLKRKWADLAPTPGDTVRLEYNGKKSNGKGGSFHDYDLAVATEEAEP